ncbi:cobalamin biosynthesis protein [Actinomadura sp. HBU206391]|uniref:cobalamin biosynthesis protein CobD/CbiB n=1 Tax=Actinomadura sp. HBU206391 TaxID=2731692 RepID=UPI00164F0894|nr:CobD/CbiB family cobalamin biosynthesis protein [Actinomadura sp. HBU206391]MBC6458255.1 cobalamin biosynthesis protein [Actinomadura sp. HBU206391]
MKDRGRSGYEDPSFRRAAPWNAAGLLAGVVLDAVLGDPRRGHPVAAFGRVAGRLERRLHADAKPPGVLYAGLCVGGAAALGLAADRLTSGGTRWPGDGRGVPPPRRSFVTALARTAVTGVATWAVLGGASLGREGMLMARSLEAGDLDAARARLPHLCARDPEGLDAKALARATVESIAENTSDAAVAPLLWGAAAGVPGLLAYRAINTLDAMVGYRSPRHENFGWASARLDDLANWIPARVTGLLTVACAPLAGATPGGAISAGATPAGAIPAGAIPAGATAASVPPSSGTSRRWPRAGVLRSREAYETLRRDGGAHPSPNAGRCEAAFAGALGVRLGGVNAYGGRVEQRPELGDGRSPEVADIRRAVRLSRAVTLTAALLSAVLSLVIMQLFTRAARRGMGER